MAPCDEEVIFLWVPLAVVDARDVALGVCHIEQVHIATNRCLLPHPLNVVDFGLVVAAAAQEVSAIRIEGKSADWVAIEGLEVFERF